MWVGSKSSTAGAGQFHGHLGSCESAQRFAQAGLGVPVTGGEAHPPLGQRGDGVEVGAQLGVGAPCETRRGLFGRVERARLEVNVDQQCEQRHCGRAHGVVVLQGAFEDVTRPRCLTLREVDGGERSGGIGIDVQPGEKLFGLLVASLAHPEVGRRTSAPWRSHER